MSAEMSIDKKKKKKKKNGRHIPHAYKNSILSVPDIRFPDVQAIVDKIASHKHVVAFDLTSKKINEPDVGLEPTTNRLRAERSTS
jgi:hypothetical protein